jgi:hypothetical protein
VTTFQPRQTVRAPWRMCSTQISPASTVQKTRYGYRPTGIPRDRASRGGMADAGITTDRVDCALDSKPDVERAARATLIKIVEDFRQIALHSPRIADDHPSRRFQSASISASEANSPRLACADSRRSPQWFRYPARANRIASRWTRAASRPSRPDPPQTACALLQWRDQEA